MIFKKRDKLGRRFAILSEFGSAAIVLLTILVAVTKDLRSAGSILFMIITVTCLGFCGLYSRSLWRSTPPGRAVMYVVGSFGAVGLMVCAQLLFKSWPGRDQMRMVTYLAVSLALYNVALTVWRYQVESKETLKHCRARHAKGYCIHGKVRTFDVPPED